MKYRDDFKVRFTKKPDFTINLKNKTVKCYLTCDVVVPTGISGNRFMENFRTFAKGYAKCDEKDTFNPEVGKKIALARAESKIYWKVRTEIKEAIRDAKKFIEGGEKFVNKAHRVIDHNEMYIGKYCTPNKKQPNEFLSQKAKSQTRDEKGRFTACTNTNKSCCNEPTKKCGKNPGAISIKINRL